MSDTYYRYLNHPWQIHASRHVPDIQIDGLPIDADAVKLFTFHNLKKTVTNLLARGPRAPGNDRVKLHRLTNQQINQLCKAIVEAVKQGDYQCANGRIKQVPKRLAGYREISIPNGIDKFLQILLLQFLTKHIEVLFYETSFGGRPGKNAHQVLTSLVEGVARTGRTVFFEIDIRGAYDNVKIEKLFQFIDDLGFSLSMVKLVKAAVLQEREFQVGLKGIPQGNPISMILMNLYLHHVLDNQIERSGIAIRYCDNIIGLASSKSEAWRLIQRFTEAAGKAGLEFKAPQIVELREKKGTLFNLGIQLNVNQLSFELPNDFWERLTEGLKTCYGKPDPVREAKILIMSMSQFFRGCLSDQQQPVHLQRLQQSIEAAGFDKDVQVLQFIEFYSRMVDLWQQELREAVRIVRRDKAVLVTHGASHRKLFDTFVHYFYCFRACLNDHLLRSRPHRWQVWRILMTFRPFIRGPPTCLQSSLMMECDRNSRSLDQAVSATDAYVANA